MKNKIIYNKKILVQLSIVFIIVGSVAVIGALAMKNFDIYAFQRGKDYPWYRAVSIIGE